MGFLDRLTGGAEKVAKEAEKVFEQGKTKVEELQLERQMDVAARKLGYLALDEHRGRGADPARRAELLEEIAGLEDQLNQMRMTVAPPEGAPAEGATTPGMATPVSPGRAGGPSGEMSGVERIERAAAATGVAPMAAGEMAEAPPAPPTDTEAPPAPPEAPAETGTPSPTPPEETS